MENKSLEELEAERKELQKRINVVNYAISSIKSGYWYLTLEMVYGSRTYGKHSNGVSACDTANEYYGDNGFCNIYTNDPTVITGEYEHGTIYFFDGNFEDCKNYLETEHYYYRFKSHLPIDKSYYTSTDHELAESVAKYKKELDEATVKPVKSSEMAE